MSPLSSRRRLRGKADAPSRRALLVTVAGFRDEEAYPRLSSAFEDGEQMRALLSRSAAYPLGGFEIERRHDATRTEIEESIEAHLDGARPGDTRFLFLSTHADRAQSVPGDKGPRKVYFVATDTTRARLTRSGIAVSQVARDIARCQASTVIVVVDTCYGASLNQKVADEVISLKWGLTEELRVPVDRVTRHSQDRRSSVVLRAADDVPGASLGYRGHSPTFIILASCRATERAAAGNGWKPSDFTRAFVEAVRGGAWVDPGVYAAMFHSLEANVRGRTQGPGQRTDLFVTGPERHTEGGSP